MFCLWHRQADIGGTQVSISVKDITVATLGKLALSSEPLFARHEHNSYIL